MKIAIVGLMRHPIAEPFAGGMESHTFWLAKKLIERGHQVTLFASGNSDASLGLDACTSSSLDSYPPAQSFQGGLACNTAAYAKAIAKICNSQFDVVHNNALHPLMLLSAADLPAPMLMTLHAVVSPTLAAAMQCAAARNTDGRLKVAAVSQKVAQLWQSIIKTDVVRNGIDVDSWPFCAVALPSTALWYGRFVPEKAPHIAIQAALKAGYFIQVAGSIDDRAYFKNSIEPLLAHPKVSYLGHLSHLEIKQALSQASVLVNAPMWEEPYGMV